MMGDFSLFIPRAATSLHFPACSWPRDLAVHWHSWIQQLCSKPTAGHHHWRVGPGPLEYHRAHQDGKQTLCPVPHRMGDLLP